MRQSSVDSSEKAVLLKNAGIFCSSVIGSSLSCRVFVDLPLILTTIFDQRIPSKNRKDGGFPRPSNPVDVFVGRAVRSGCMCGKKEGARRRLDAREKSLEESTGEEKDRRNPHLRRSLSCSLLHWHGPCPEGSVHSVIRKDSGKMMEKI